MANVVTPKKRKASKKGKGRRVRRRTMSRPRRALARMGGSFPKKMLVTMRYATSIRLSQTIGSIPVAYTFRANSIFDPDRSGTGHQPYTHDEYAQLYNKYMVTGSKIVATFLPNASSSTGNVICGLHVGNDPAYTPNFETIREQSEGRWSIVSGQTNKKTLATRYSRRKVIPAHKDGHEALFGANPAEEYYFTMWSSCVDTVAVAGSVDVVVTISYRVLMWDAKVLPQS